MDTLSYIIGRNSAGGGTAITPTWSEVTQKPFETVGTGLTVTEGVLESIIPDDGIDPSDGPDYDSPYWYDSDPDNIFVDYWPKMTCHREISEVDGVTTTTYSKYYEWADINLYKVESRVEALECTEQPGESATYVLKCDITPVYEDPEDPTSNIVDYTYTYYWVPEGGR